MVTTKLNSPYPAIYPYFSYCGPSVNVSKFVSSVYRFKTKFISVYHFLYNCVSNDQRINKTELAELDEGANQQYKDHKQPKE